MNNYMKLKVSLQRALQTPEYMLEETMSGSGPHKDFK